MLGAGFSAGDGQRTRCSCCLTTLEQVCLHTASGKAQGLVAAIKVAELYGVSCRLSSQHEPAKSLFIQELLTRVINGPEANFLPEIEPKLLKKAVFDRGNQPGSPYQPDSNPPARPASQQPLHWLAAHSNPF